MARLVDDWVWGVLTVWQEARGESYIGKVAVSEVIQRRAKQKYSSDGTIAGTVLRKYQFSGWNTDDPNRVKSSKIDDTDSQVQECIKAWREAEGGSDYSNGAVLYYNPSTCTPLWASKSKEVAVIGKHRFLVPKEEGK